MSLEVSRPCGGKADLVPQIQPYCQAFCLVSCFWPGFFYQLFLQMLAIFSSPVLSLSPALPCCKFYPPFFKALVLCLASYSNLHPACWSVMFRSLLDGLQCSLNVIWHQLVWKILHLHFSEKDMQYFYNNFNESLPVGNGGPWKSQVNQELVHLMLCSGDHGKNQSKICKFNIFHNKYKQWKGKSPTPV